MAVVGRVEDGPDVLLELSAVMRLLTVRMLRSHYGSRQAAPSLRPHQRWGR